MLNPLITSQKPNNQTSVGGVAEWLNAPVLKTDVGESLPWVRIPPPPPLHYNLVNKNNILHKFLGNIQAFWVTFWVTFFVAPWRTMLTNFWIDLLPK